VIPIEIQLLIDRLEALLVESRPVPFTSNVLIDRDRCFDIINQMRVSVPEEIKKARRVTQERDRVLAQAKEEADRLIALARQRANSLVNDSEIVSQTEGRVESVIERAQREADEIKSGADEYALGVLRELEAHLGDQLKTIRNGISALDTRYREPYSSGD
jgi:cell division septum initiation protein DivIVA